MLGNVRSQKESDCALMLSFAAGDLGGFELLYKRHRQSVYQFFYFGTHGDVSLTDDLFHDVWMTVVRGRIRYTDDISFTDWLYHSSWARLHDHLRLYPLDGKVFDAKQKKDATVVKIDSYLGLEESPSNNSEEAGSAEKQKSETEKGNTLLHTISKMNPEHKEVTLLQFCFSMGKQEIADFLDVNKSVVDRLSREAVTMLRSDLAAATAGAS